MSYIMKWREQAAKGSRASKIKNFATCTDYEMEGASSRRLKSIQNQDFCNIQLI
jgi:hypothetical protein